MFFAQSIEHSRPKGKYRHMAQLYIWRVELNASGRLIWQLHNRGYWAKANYEALQAEEKVRNQAWANVPFMQEAAPGKLVTMRQAEVLTGIRAPAALDNLSERVLQGVQDQENYVKPKRVKEPKPRPEPKPEPSPAEVARAAQTRALAKVAEWERRAVHATRKAKEWNRRANYHGRRVRRCNAQPITLNGVLIVADKFDDGGPAFPRNAIERDFLKDGGKAENPFQTHSEVVQMQSRYWQVERNMGGASGWLSTDYQASGLTHQEALEYAQDVPGGKAPDSVGN